MEPDKQEQTAVNDARTPAASDARLTHGSSRTVLEKTRRDLIVMREAHGADSPIGHRCSNIIELIQEPEPRRDLIRRQMNDLAQLMVGLQ